MEHEKQSMTDSPVDLTLPDLVVVVVVVFTVRSMTLSSFLNETSMGLDVAASIAGLCVML